MVFQPATFPVNGPNVLPFVSVANGNTTVPFAVNPSNQQSPFTTQAVNASTFAIDSLQIDFINTESPLNVKGKVTTAFFY